MVYYGNKPQRYLQNRVSYTCMDKDGNLSTTNDQSFTYYSYDPHGNVEWLVQEQPEIGRSYMAYEYDLVSGSVIKVRYNEEQSDKFFHRYTYDADKRIKMVETSTDGVIWDKDDTYEYYAHGPLKRRNIGEDKVQGLDFVYTLQGWLKGINHPSLLTANDPGTDSDASGTHTNTAKDIYGMVLGYYSGDYNRTYSSAASPYNSDGTNAYNLAGTPLFNGNISSWTNNIDYTAPGGGNRYENLTGNIYRYDVLNRIKKSDFREYSSSAWNNRGDYDETFSYDANGNILTLNRHGRGDVQTEMDSLIYHYINNTNQLEYVDDDAPNPSTYAVDIDDQSAGNYTYDSIGNLISDSQEGITKIAWNPYGKVDTVYKSSGEKLVFLYDPSGNRIRKEVIKSASDPEQNSTTFYVRDASGNVMATYVRRNALLFGSNYLAAYKLMEEPIYGSSRVGERLDSIVVRTAGFTLTDPPAAPTLTAEHRDAWESMQLPVQAYTHVGSWYIAKTSFRELDNGAVASNAALNVGIQGKNSCSVEDECGNPLIKVYVAKQYNNATNVALVFNGGNHLMLNSSGIKANANGQSELLKVPGSSSLYYLFTVGTDKKAYYHIIDAAQRKVISKNNLIDSNTGYGQTMAVLEDVAGSASSMLYLRKYAAGTCTVVGCSITAQGISAPAALTSFTSNDVNGIGQMTLSPDASQLMIGNNLGSQIMLGVYTTGGELRSYSMSSTHDALVAGSTQALGAYTAAKSVAYTASGNNVYANIIKVFQSTVKRYASDFTSNLAISTHATGDVRRGNDDSLYVAWVQGTSLTKISAPDATPSLTSVSIGSSGILTGGMPTQRHRIDYGLTCPTPLYTRTLGKKQYELDDHLGNVRVVISDWKQSVLTSGVPGSFSAETRSYYNYYAFGMEEVGRNYNGVNYRFGFNGKEGDTEWDGGGNTYDYGFRIYNPRLGKFLSVDPLTGSYPWFTPYQFAANKPINSIDVDGLEDETVNTAQGMAIANMFLPKDKQISVQELGKIQEAYSGGRAKGVKVGLIMNAMVFIPNIGIPWAVSDITGLPVTPSPQAWSFATAPNAAFNSLEEAATEGPLAQEASATNFTPSLETTPTESGYNMFTLGEETPQAANTYNAIMDGAPLPGLRGASLGAKRLSNEEMNLLTEKYKVEFAQVYTEGTGPNGGGGQYHLYSGTANSVDVPLEKGSYLINHTHPGGTPLPSTYDRNYLLNMQSLGSPQKSSIILPSGGLPVRFNTTTPVSGSGNVKPPPAVGTYPLSDY